MGDYGEHRKRLVKELKRRIVAAGGEGVSVRGGSGTAWSWLNVWGTNGADFTEAQRRAIEDVTGGRSGLNCWVGRIEEIERILGIDPPWKG